MEIMNNIGIIQDYRQVSQNQIQNEYYFYTGTGIYLGTVILPADRQFMADARIFAYIRKLADGSREIRFVERYPDGSYSPEFDIKQSGLLEVITWQKYQDSLMERDAKRTLRNGDSKCRANYQGAGRGFKVSPGRI